MAPGDPLEALDGSGNHLPAAINCNYRDAVVLPAWVFILSAPAGRPAAASVSPPL